MKTVNKTQYEICYVTHPPFSTKGDLNGNFSPSTLLCSILIVEVPMMEVNPVMVIHDHYLRLRKREISSQEGIEIAIYLKLSKENKSINFLLS